MEKLFYKDPYIKEFVAEIVDIVEIDSKFHIVLDNTAFFPGGGGQFCDLGKIENHDVIDVYEKDQVIYHVVYKKPIKIHKAKCSIDWQRRLDGMNQHLAQHVLSGCFFTLFKSNTDGFHLGQDISTIDIKGTVDEDQIKKVEEYANNIINDDLTVEFLTPSKRELKKLNLRRDLPKTNEEIRVVKIEDLDINACCGVHHTSTSKLRMIKIKRWEKNRDNTRIEYVAGHRAVEYVTQRDQYLKDICRLLKCGEIDVINSIKSLNEKVNEISNQKKKLESVVANYEINEMINDAEKIQNLNVITKIYKDEDIKYVSRTISKIVENENTIVLTAVENEDRINLIFACSNNIKNISMNDLLKDCITLLDGRGGGNKTLAQGGGKNNGNLLSTLDYAMNKLKKMVI